MEDIQKTIFELYEKYENDDYVIQKMENYIKVTLPALLSTYKDNYHNRKENNKKIKQINDIFIHKYINKNAKDIFKLLFSLRNKNRIIIFATHNRYFADMSDCKLSLIDGKVITINARN